MTPTTEEIAMLHKAIDLAKDSGECQYVKGGEPCCVIGQLAVLKGISLEQLPVGKVTVMSYTMPDLGISKSLLLKIQNVWDGVEAASCSDEQRRAEMHKIVDEAS